MKILQTQFLLLSFLLFQAFIANAQTQVIYDVFSNEEYKYIKKYKEVKDYELNLNREIDIEYFAMRNEQGNNFDKLNLYIESMALNEWKDKQKKFELTNAIKAKIADYNALKLRNNNRYEHGIENDFNTQLRSIEINVISVCNNVITYFQNYEYIAFSNHDGYHQNEIEINITRYYTADTYTQNSIPLIAIYKEGSMTAIQQEIMPLLNQYVNELKLYLQENPDDEAAPDEYDDDSETGYYRKDDVNKSKSNNKIDLKDAEFYWYGWGLMLKFPDFCKSSYINKGESFSLFIPFDQCKVTLELFPAYGSYKKLSKPINQFSNFDYFEVLSEYSKFRHEPSVTSLFKFNNVLEKPKKLTASSYQTFKNDQRNFRGDFIYEFIQTAKNFQQHAAKTTHSYYLENYNGKTTKRLNKQKTKKNTHVYDDKENLIIRKSDELFEGSDYYYFYNADNCYSFKTESSEHFGDEQISKTSFKNGQLCLSDMCITFNKNMHVVAVKMLKFQNNDIELGYDEKGHLIEAHTENDRYHYYYEYDAANRLVKYSTYEFQRISKEMVYYYKEQERLPYLQKKHTYNNDIFEEEQYLWEY
jgi:hypothetical protein